MWVKNVCGVIDFGCVLVLCLEDVFTFELEEDVVGGIGTDGSCCCSSGIATFRRRGAHG